MENKCVEEPGGVKKEVCAQLCNVADVFAAMAAKAKRNATRTQPYAFPGYACINGQSFCFVVVGAVASVGGSGVVVAVGVVWGFGPLGAY